MHSFAKPDQHSLTNPVDGLHELHLVDSLFCIVLVHADSVGPEGSFLERVPKRTQDLHETDCCLMRVATEPNSGLPNECQT